MKRHRWFLPCALLVASACASKAPTVSTARPESGTKPDPAKSPAVALSQTELRRQTVALLTNETRPPTREDWTRLGPGALGVLEQLYGDAASPVALRLEAISAMGQLPEPAAAEALHRIARDIQVDVQFRSVAVLALVNRSGQAAVDELIPLLNAPEETIRETAAKALGKAGGSVAQSSLEEQLERETEPGVRDAIQQSLTKIQP